MVKIFTASLKEEHITNCFESCYKLQALIEIDVADNKGDIEKFVQNEMSKLQLGWSDEVQLEVRHTLVNKGDGM